MCHFLGNVGNREGVSKRQQRGQQQGHPFLQGVLSKRQQEVAGGTVLFFWTRGRGFCPFLEFGTVPFSKFTVMFSKYNYKNKNTEFREILDEWQHIL